IVKCLRYIHTSCHWAGSQFCQESGVTVWGSVTEVKALSSNSGCIAAAENFPPNSQSLSSEMLRWAGPEGFAGAAALWPHVRTEGVSAAAAVAARMNSRREICLRFFI